jgi:TetR/AcrR family transcriptional regulator, transcriptional repressor for nem operon
MRYASGHKERIRKRILAAAGKSFRRNGYNGIGIDQIMAVAKLTRGGFYGYFKSKAQLFAAVLRTEHGFNAMMKRRDAGDADALNRQAMDIVGGYLNPKNRREIGGGCSLASLSIDVARAGRPAKEAYGEKLHDLRSEFARGLPDGAETDERALRAIALSVGGVILSRALVDDELALALTSACRNGVARELSVEPL